MRKKVSGIKLRSSDPDLCRAIMNKDLAEYVRRQAGPIEGLRVVQVYMPELTVIVEYNELLPEEAPIADG